MSLHPGDDINLLPDDQTQRYGFWRTSTHNAIIAPKRKSTIYGETAQSVNEIELMTSIRSLQLKEPLPLNLTPEFSLTKQDVKEKKQIDKNVIDTAQVTGLATIAENEPSTKGS